MTALRVYRDDNSDDIVTQSTDATEIQHQLATLGVRFEQWRTRSEVKAGDDAETVLKTYQAEVDALVAQQGYQSVDVISLDNSHPDKAALREKFLSEHCHSEDEVRFFADGCGLFALHIGTMVYEVLCERGDLISVPANTPHWFDLGPTPALLAIRFFNNPDGWVAHYTGSDIAQRYSRLDTL